MANPRPVFPNYLQIPSRVPQQAWHVLRLVSVTTAIALSIVLIARPQLGLLVFWGVVVPSLPLVFFVAPGLWRNICPLAAVNQTPRLFRWSRGLNQPRWLKEYAYVIGILLFLTIAASRAVLFNHSGLASALLILGALLGAFLGGLVFKGKSGWCSSICPLLPVQRIYGQTPFLLLPNSHCRPCVGCTHNCYDFNPQVAYLADLYESDPHYTAYRKFFAGAFPGFIVGFFTVPAPPAASVAATYLGIALATLISAGSFYAIESFFKVTAHKITALYAAVALNLFYWFAAPLVSGAVGTLLGFTPPTSIIWAVRLVLLSLTIAWVVRTYAKEARFIAQATVAQMLHVASPTVLRQHQAAQSGQPEVVIMPENRRFAVEAGQTLLEIVEHNELPIEAGCRMGVCGADPIAILDGMEHVSPMGDDERATLERLGLAPNTRLACCARVHGSVHLQLKPERGQKVAQHPIPSSTYDPEVERVVIIGNGIAGITAADHVRRRHPSCEIHLIGREKHFLYNRMAISRLIYGRSAMQGLYLMPDTWYEEHNITCWINTPAIQIDREQHEVVVASGEHLAYDRLILTAGSSSFVPAIEGFGLGGSFVLREADDAMRIRSFSQQHNCRRAVVAGGGLLGLEAAYALHKLGLHTAVLERSDRLLTRQLDARGSAILREYLERLGLHIVTRAETDSLEGDEAFQQLLLERPDLKEFFYSKGRVAQVRLKDGRTLPGEIFLVAAGIQANMDLARDAALEVKRGIVVDDHMRTSDPHIFAAGDVAEYQGKIMGLWATAVEQGEVAAMNAVGGDKSYQETIPMTILKVVGVDLVSIGHFEPRSENDDVIALEDTAEQRYRKLVISQGKIVGAILLGYPRLAPSVTAAIKQGRDVAGYVPELQDGRWEVLDQAQANPVMTATVA